MSLAWVVLGTTYPRGEKETEGPDVSAGSRPGAWVRRRGGGEGQMAGAGSTVTAGYSLLLLCTPRYLREAVA